MGGAYALTEQKLIYYTWYVFRSKPRLEGLLQYVKGTVKQIFWNEIYVFLPCVSLKNFKNENKKYIYMTNQICTHFLWKGNQRNQCYSGIKKLNPLTKTRHKKK